MQPGLGTLLHSRPGSRTERCVGNQGRGLRLFASIRIPRYSTFEKVRGTPCDIDNRIQFLTDLGIDFLLGNAVR